MVFFPVHSCAAALCCKSRIIFFTPFSSVKAVDFNCMSENSQRSRSNSTPTKPNPSFHTGLPSPQSPSTSPQASPRSDASSPTEDLQRAATTGEFTTFDQQPKSILRVSSAKGLTKRRVEWQSGTIVEFTAYRAMSALTVPKMHLDLNGAGIFPLATDTPLSADGRSGGYPFVVDVRNKGVVELVAESDEERKKWMGWFAQVRGKPLSTSPRVLIPKDDSGALRTRAMSLPAFNPNPSPPGSGNTSPLQRRPTMPVATSQFRPEAQSQVRSPRTVSFMDGGSSTTMAPERLFSAEGLRRVRAMYEHYCPEKLSNIPKIVEAWFGREQDLIIALIEKYGPEPETIRVTTTTSSTPLMSEPSNSVLSPTASAESNSSFVAPVVPPLRLRCSSEAGTQTPFRVTSSSTAASVVQRRAMGASIKCPTRRAMYGDLEKLESELLATIGEYHTWKRHR